MDRWVDFQQRRIVNRIHLNGKNLLDVGCGRGEYLKLFAEKIGHKNIQGIDVYKSDVKGIQILKGTAEKLPLSNKSFDIVFEKDALHHIDNKKNALEEMKRVARNEVILIEANLKNKIMDIFIDKRYHDHFSLESLTELLGKEKYLISFIEAFPFGSNKIFILKIFNYLPKAITKIIFKFTGIIMDMFEGKKAAFIVCRIRINK